MEIPSTSDSSRAGGQYSVTGTAVESIKKLSGKERALLTTWLCNQRRAGVECPKITSVDPCSPNADRARRACR